MTVPRAITLILDSIGRSEEYEHYLRKFRSDTSPAFALLCPDLDSLRQMSEAFLFDLQFMRDLNLFPAIVLSGPFVEEMKGFFANRPEIRIVPECSRHDEQETSRIMFECRESRQIPVIAEQCLSLPRTLKRLAPLLSRRIHLIRMLGALKNRDGNGLNDYLLRENREQIDPEENAIVALSTDLIEAIPDCHLSVTSPYNLLKEIFTVKGAGTVFRNGSRIRTTERLSDDETDRMVLLLEESFGKKLKSPHFLEQITHFYIEENFRAAALLIETETGAYLSKFAVGTDARGAGIAQDLWKRMIEHHPRLFWRARNGNSINRWYAVIADGSQRGIGYTVFWKGIPVPSIPDAIDYAISQPIDFIE